jgi:hypothetical protein
MKERGAKKGLGRSVCYRCSLCGGYVSTHTTTAVCVLAGHRAAHRRSGKKTAGMKWEYVGTTLPVQERLRREGLR